jgi:3-oxoacyl-[acyl-carrier protein] reductase
VTAARTVLLTGGSRGIGLAVSEALRADGWKVIAPTRLEMDLSKPTTIATFLNTLSERIDGLVLGAGVNRPAQIGKQTLEQWEAINAVNTLSNVALVSALCPAMASSGFGRIVGISSAYANRARPGRAAYSASKAALEALVRAVAVEFAGSGVVANCVAPGFVDTELTRANNTPEMIEAVLHRIPIGRLATPSEVGRAVAFLMAPDNAYITGHTLVVDGGFACT